MPGKDGGRVQQVLRVVSRWQGGEHMRPGTLSPGTSAPPRCLLCSGSSGLSEFLLIFSLLKCFFSLFFLSTFLSLPQPDFAFAR